MDSRRVHRKSFRISNRITEHATEQDAIHVLQSQSCLKTCTHNTIHEDIKHRGTDNAQTGMRLPFALCWLLSSGTCSSSDPKASLLLLTVAALLSHPAASLSNRSFAMDARFECATANRNRRLSANKQRSMMSTRRLRAGPSITFEVSSTIPL
jgi:hypothetical protein